MLGYKCDCRTQQTQTSNCCNVLDLEAENRILDESKKSRIKFLAKELDKLWALEEIKARGNFSL
jgi:hypothetical protein